MALLSVSVCYIFIFYKSQSCNRLLFAKHTLPPGVSPLSGSHAPHTPPPPHSLRDLHSHRGPSQPSQSLWQHLNTVLVTWVRMSLERLSRNPRLPSFLQGTSVHILLSPVHLASATISGRGTKKGERAHPRGLPGASPFEGSPCPEHHRLKTKSVPSTQRFGYMHML